MTNGHNSFWAHYTNPHSENLSFLKKRAMLCFKKEVPQEFSCTRRDLQRVEGRYGKKKTVFLSAVVLIVSHNINTPTAMAYYKPSSPAKRWLIDWNCSREQWDRDGWNTALFPNGFLIHLHGNLKLKTRCSASSAVIGIICNTTQTWFMNKVLFLFDRLHKVFLVGILENSDLSYWNLLIVFQPTCAHVII